MVQPGEIDRHGLRVAEQKTRAHEEQRRQKDGAERVDMLQRVEGDTPCPPGRIVAQMPGDKSVRRLVKCHGENNREHPGRGLPQHPRPFRRRVHAGLDPVGGPPAISSANRRPAAPAVEIVAPLRRNRLGAATRACASGVSFRAEAAISSTRACRRCNAAPGRNRHRGRAGRARRNRRQRPHRDVVRDQHAVEADIAADDAVDHDRDNVAGAASSIAV